MPLPRHSVFFSRDYAAEFEDVFTHGRLPREPTVYVCAQDRLEPAGPPATTERLLCLVNAPADGDRVARAPKEIDGCRDRMFAFLARCGLKVTSEEQATCATTPADFERLFPATGGALYGAATHGWNASFRRPGSGTRLPGLYLAGGSAHPGAGVPMAAISGRLAARQVLSHLASTSAWRLAAMPGGTSTR
jgi:1-hydroxycarotenoid 3,4-desaturase